MMTGIAPTGQTVDFFAFDSDGDVWNGAAFVTWADADYDDYRISATELGTSGRYTGTEPAGATRYELRLRDATLAGSVVFWEDALSVTVATNNDKTGYSLGTSERVKLHTTQPDYAPAKAGDAMALTSNERTALTGVIWAALTSGLTTVGSIGKLLVDRIDAAISSVSGGGSGLTGPRSITLTWEDENGDPVPSVEFTVVGAGSTRAEPDGTKSFGLNDGTYTVVSNTTNGVIFEPFTLTVNGTEDETITGETSQLPSTSAPGKRTVVVDLTTFSDLEIESVEDVAIKARFRILDSMGLDDNSVTAVVTADGQTIVPRTIPMPDSDADGRSSAGFVPTASMTVPSGYVAAYSFYADNRKIRTVAVGSGASVLLGSLTAVTDNNDD